MGSRRIVTGDILNGKIHKEFQNTVKVDQTTDAKGTKYVFSLKVNFVGMGRG